MIIGMVAPPGSNKTLSAVREICLHRKRLFFTNFETKELKNTIRLKKEDVIFPFYEGKSYKPKINWEFWEHVQNKFKDYSIMLDEVHNIAGHREGLKKENILYMKWLMQIRKILSDKPHNHLYAITQDYEHFDISWRRIMTCIFYFEKELITKKGVEYNKVTVYGFVSRGTMSARRRFEAFIQDRKLRTWNIPRHVFIGNPYYKYYDRNKLVKGDDEWL